MHHLISGAKKIQIPLQLDSIAILHNQTLAIGLYDILIESVSRSIRMIERTVTEQKLATKLDEVGVPQTYNFLPKDLGHFFSCVYFSNSDDKGG